MSLKTSPNRKFRQISLGAEDGTLGGDFICSAIKVMICYEIFVWPVC